MYGAQQILYLFIEPDFNEQAESFYADFNTNEEGLQLDTEYTTIAASLFFTNDGSGTEYPDAETVARIGFYGAHRFNSTTIEFHFYPAARCKDIYAPEIESGNDFYRDEFSADGWICPDIRNIPVFNNPFIFDSGTNFVMVVNDCTVAVESDMKNNLTSYTDSECLSTEDAKTFVDDMRVYYKIMGQNFNPSEYSQNLKTSSVMKRRFTTDLMTLFTVSMKIGVRENKISLFDSWFVDLRDFAFFI